MKIQIATPSYNERRYGKPWIARVDFPDAKGVFNFGEWVGQNGTSGLLIIDVQPGDIIAMGQKDHRNMSNSAPDFFLVPMDAPEHLESNSYRALDEAGFARITKADAYQHYQDRAKGNADSTDYQALLNEREALIARIAEIDAVIAATQPEGQA